MARLEITIDSIFNGKAPSGLFGEAGQYQHGIGIDPDMPITDASTDRQTGGIIRPVNYTPFSGGLVNSAPIAIIKTPKNTNTYVILSNGRIIRYSKTQDTETLIGTLSYGSARGAFYHNNYIYIIGPTDVARYGPLNGTPALVEGVWTGATLGSLTALTNTQYPTSLLGHPYLNHFGVVHVDGAAYFLDYKDGVGMVHMINTKKTTYEGDTNDTTRPSAYNVLDLPKNYLPIAITPLGNDLVVSASLTQDNVVTQGGCALFFFNPADTEPSYYRVINLKDDICSGLIYPNGVLLGFAGALDGSGYRLFQWIGGDSVQTLKAIEDGYPPLQGAIDAIGNKVVWGGNTNAPLVTSGLYAYGSKNDLFPRGLHHIALSGFTT